MDLPYNGSQSLCDVTPKSHWTAVDGRTAVHSNNLDRLPDDSQSSGLYPVLQLHFSDIKAYQMRDFVPLCDPTTNGLDVPTLWAPDIPKEELVGRVWEVGESHGPVPVYPDIHEEMLVGRVWEVGECPRLVCFYPDIHERMLVGRVWEVGEPEPAVPSYSNSCPCQSVLLWAR